MTIATETLDNIESANWADWSVRQFYAATVDCFDIVNAVESGDIVERANCIADLLFATCAVKHGCTALAEFALSY
jgi:hypothetical protein